MTKPELIERCKELNLPLYGTKFDMIQRILASQKPGILSNIRHAIPPIVIRRDSKHNVYLHEPSRLVFDPDEKQVVGRLNDQGIVQPLQYRDIQQCLLYKFKYTLPENLALTQDQTPQKNTETSVDDRLQERLQHILDETHEPNNNDDDTDDDLDDQDDG